MELPRRHLVRRAALPRRVRGVRGAICRSTHVAAHGGVGGALPKPATSARTAGHWRRCRAAGSCTTAERGAARRTCCARRHAEDRQHCRSRCAHDRAWQDVAQRIRYRKCEGRARAVRCAPRGDPRPGDAHLPHHPPARGARQVHGHGEVTQRGRHLCVDPDAGPRASPQPVQPPTSSTTSWSTSSTTRRRRRTDG